METLNEGVVQEEHDTGEPPRPALVPEEHLTDVTDVLDFGVAETEFPGYDVSPRRLDENVVEMLTRQPAKCTARTQLAQLSR